ncbi:MAG: hypothetical protein ABI543_12365 [Ignavibacteria bacterium]
MKELKIVQILKTFSKEELKLFRKFAESPYFNEGRNMLPLIDELVKFYPDFSKRGFSKEKIFNSLYDGEKYDEGAADKQLSRAAGLAKKFLLQQAFENEIFQKNITQAREYNRRKLDSLFLEQISRTEDDLNRGSAFNEDFFENKVSLESVRSGFLLTNKDIVKYKNFLLVRSDYAILDIMLKYIYSKQDIVLGAYNFNVDIQNSLTNKASGLIDLDGLIKLVNLSGNPYAYVLEYKYRELNAMLELNIKNFILYKEVVYGYLDRLSWSEKFNALGAMHSICIMGTQAGMMEFEKESVIVCKKMISENSYSFYENSYANMTRYFNILLTLIRNNENNYIDELIKQFGNRLNPENRESMINYGYMNKYFNIGDFQRALIYHAKIDYNHSLLKLNVRLLLLKIYCELGYTEEAESLIDTSLKYYDTLTGVSDKVLLRALNLTKFTRRLLKLKNSGDINKLEDLFGEVKSSEDVNSKPWLLEKISKAMKI